MTNKIMNVMLAGVALAMLTAAPALALCPTCTLTANALVPNVFTNNVFTNNVLSTNSLTTNSITTNTTSAQPTNSAGALGRVVAVELPRR
jgi:hypothetical protein